MKKRLIAVLIILVFAPLALMAGLGARLLRNEQAALQQQQQELLANELARYDHAIAEWIAGLERYLHFPINSDTSTLEEHAKDLHASGWVMNTFLVDNDAHVQRLDGLESLTPDRIEEYSLILDHWHSRESQPLPAPPASKLQGIMKGAPSQSSKGAMPQVQQRALITQNVAQEDAFGWYTFFERHGLQFVYWQHLGNNVLVGAELNRARLLSEIIALLPDNTPTTSMSRHGIQLMNAKGEVFYRWGAYESGADEQPQAHWPLSVPLQAWRFEYYLDGAAQERSIAALLLLMIPTFAGIGLILLALGIYFYRESSRDMREAAQRITFVNQVSHELKTPLTNIRMYAELLSEDIDEEDPLTKRLRVIVSESQRLSRMIGNILTFSRRERKKLQLHATLGCVDDKVQEVLATMAPGLEAKGIVSSLECHAANTVSFDADVLEQILSNLISNVEKYAASGGYLGIATIQQGDSTAIIIADRGPGISTKEARRIFQPFYRISNQLNDGVAGTGIGLAIARDLARLHGGDLRWQPSDQGACFEVALHTPSTGNSK